MLSGKDWANTLKCAIIHGRCNSTSRCIIAKRFRQDGYEGTSESIFCKSTSHKKYNATLEEVPMDIVDSSEESEISNQTTPTGFAFLDEESSIEENDGSNDANQENEEEMDPDVLDRVLEDLESDSESLENENDQSEDLRERWGPYPTEE